MEFAFCAIVQRTRSPTLDILWISNEPFEVEVLLLFKFFMCISSVLLIDGEPWAKWCCGVASGTRRRRKPDVQPHGTILKEIQFEKSFQRIYVECTYHLTASRMLKYQGIKVNFSFLLTASIILSATSLELSVLTHLERASIIKV